MMNGGHGPTKYLQDLNWSTFDHASHALQLRSCNYYILTTCHMYDIVCAPSRMLLRLNCVVKRCCLEVILTRLRMAPPTENHNGSPLIVQKHSNVLLVRMEEHHG